MQMPNAYQAFRQAIVSGFRPANKQGRFGVRKEVYSRLGILPRQMRIGGIITDREGWICCFIFDFGVS